MEVSGQVFTTILSPLAAIDQTRPSVEELVEDSPPTFPSSPPHSVDAVSPSAPPTWTVDEVALNGQRFFAIPTFASNAPPLRIDVYIPSRDTWPRSVKECLDPDAAIYQAKGEAATLPISQHLAKALQHWSAQIPNFEQLYFNMPFGSQIMVDSLTLRPEDTEIEFIPSYDAEEAMCSIQDLQRMWSHQISSWPPTIELDDLQYQRQMHEAISLVRISSRHRDQLLVFKSLIRDQRYMYNELKLLLELDPHPNIIRKPLYIVTKKCRFGGKRGVCGFILEYYPLGSLQGRLRDVASGVQPPPTLTQCYKWAREVVEALIHINSLPTGFYPDLKPDNIVFRDTRSGLLEAVLLDFEQRGGWFSWSPPEVLYIEYMEILGTQLEEPQLRNEIIDQLRRYMPGWSPAVSGRRYRDAHGGFSAAWLALTRFEDELGRRTAVEQAQVFLMGKLLWCIFEGQPFVRCGIDHDLLRDPDPGPERFPEFCRTPGPIQQLIRDCTCGAPEWEGRPRGIVLRGGKMLPAVLRDGDEGDATPEQVYDAARSWWATEVEKAQAFLKEVSNFAEDKMQESSRVLEQARRRPLLHAVLARLTV